MPSIFDYQKITITYKTICYKSGKDTHQAKGQEHW